MSEHLRDAAHDAVRQVGFLELIEPMLVIFFKKNVLDGFFQNSAILPPTFDAGKAIVGE